MLAFRLRAQSEARTPAAIRRNPFDTELERRERTGLHARERELGQADGLKNTAPSGGNVTLIE